MKTYTCSVCRDTYTKTIAAKGHSYTSAVITPATCTVNGLRTCTCQRCKDSCTEVIAATGHSFVNEVCTLCGEAAAYMRGDINNDGDINGKDANKLILYLNSTIMTLD